MTKHHLIIKSVQIITGVTLAEMRQKTRRRTIVDARKLTAAIIREMTGMSLWDIAKLLNNEDGHYCSNSVVMHYIACDRDEVDRVYLANRTDIVNRVNRLYIPQATAKEAWQQMWGEVALPCLI